MMLGRKRVARATYGLCVALAVACRVPQQVHEPREYPPVKIASRALDLRVVDSRAADGDPNARELSLPSDFEARARARLEAQLSGTGSELRVVVSLAQLDALELVDARGEMTRVVCRLELEIGAAGGPVLRRAETQSNADLPRDEATPDEIASVLGATAIDAFDRYFADARTLEALNRDLAAQAAR
jgi:hypothetical protein